MQRLAWGRPAWKPASSSVFCDGQRTAFALICSASDPKSRTASRAVQEPESELVLGERMNEQQKDAPCQSPVVRPALIASERTLSEYSTYLEHFLVGFVDESIPVVLICPPDSDAESFVSGPVELIGYPAIRLPFMGHHNRKRLVQQLSNFKPTVLHCLCESRARLTRHLARQLGLPYLLAVNSLRTAGIRLSISWRHCAKLIVPTRTVAEDLADAYPRWAERIEQITIGTFVEQDSTCFSKPSHLASMVIAYPLDNPADFENLFSAVRHLAIGGYEFALVVMGAGRAERPLRKLLAALDLLQSVTIVPRLKPWRAVLAAGDIFIQPRPTVSFDPLMLEAMSVGSAVAACKGGVDDLIIENETAVLFDPADELSIRGTLQRLFDRPEFARQLARAAQGCLRQNHSVSNMISATLQAYRQAQQWFQQQ